MLSSTLSLAALAYLLLPASARVVWLQEEFDPLVGHNPLMPRDTSTCGGDASLTPCGGGMPTGFCCSSGYSCLALDTESSVTAAICCPEGQSCTTINPISCDTSLQNTTITQLHANPPQELDTCGSACCPMGFACKNKQCVARKTPTPPASATTSVSSMSSSTASQTSTSGPKTSAAGVSVPVTGSESMSPSPDFNGKSFAAGFIPGLVLGAFIAACLILLVMRKRRKSTSSHIDEKGNSRDTLTDLGTLEYRRPTAHGRNISEPKADPSAGHRTDFLRGSPPRAGEPTDTNNGYATNVHSSAAAHPVTPINSPPRIKALFSRSPFLSQAPSTPPATQPPIPAHLKRGTLSFKISPVRALKKQRSVHSLRRQLPTRRPSPSRSASTETIQVLMPSNEPYTPEPKPTYHPSPSTWDTSSSPAPVYATSSRYPSEIQKPTRPPLPTGTLGSPYTPTNCRGGGLVPRGLVVQRDPGADRRDTTFSAMMEKAGLRRSDLMGR